MSIYGIVFLLAIYLSDPSLAPWSSSYQHLLVIPRSKCILWGEDAFAVAETSF